MLHQLLTNFHFLNAQKFGFSTEIGTFSDNLIYICRRKPHQSDSPQRVGAHSQMTMFQTLFNADP